MNPLYEGHTVIGGIVKGLKSDKSSIISFELEKANFLNRPDSPVTSQGECLPARYMWRTKKVDNREGIADGCEVEVYVNEHASGKRVWNEETALRRGLLAIVEGVTVINRKFLSGWLKEKFDESEESAEPA